MAFMLVDRLEDFQEVVPSAGYLVYPGEPDLAAALDHPVGQREGVLLFFVGLLAHPVGGAVPSFFLEEEGHLKVEL